MLTRTEHPFLCFWKQSFHQGQHKACRPDIQGKIQQPSLQTEDVGTASQARPSGPLPPGTAGVGAPVTPMSSVWPET